MALLQGTEWTSIDDNEEHPGATEWRKPRRKGLRRNQTFAGRGEDRRCPVGRTRRTVPLFPPPSRVASLPDVLGIDPLSQTEVVRAVSHCSTIGPLSVDPAATLKRLPGARSGSSGYSSWLASTGGTAASLDSALSLSSGVSKQTSLDWRWPVEDGTTQSPWLLEPVVWPGRVVETTCVTAVFEVLQRGLRHVAQSVRDQVRSMQQNGMMVVCCEMRWSVPSEYKDAQTETKIKADLQLALRANNHRVLDHMERIGRAGESAESVTEEYVGVTGGRSTGVYRRYYEGLLALAHQQALTEHGEWWTMDKQRVDKDVHWPLIGSTARVSAVMINIICVQIE